MPRASFAPLVSALFLRPSGCRKVAMEREIVVCAQCKPLAFDKPPLS